MRHIVHIIPTLQFGGAEKMVVELIRHQTTAENRFSIITFFDAIPLASELPAGVDVFVVPKKGKLDVGLISRIANKLQVLQPDVVHTHLFGGDVWGRLAARRLGIPVITTEHNINVGESWVHTAVKRLLRRQSQSYVALSQAIADYMRRAYGIEQTTIIPTGVDLARYATIASPTLGSPLKILLLGRLTVQKGQVIALRALSQIRHFNWRLTIAGNGEDREKLVHMTNAFALADRVRLISATHDVPKLLAEHDVLLMPSLWEGLGIVAREAMAAERVVIASRTGGLAEFVVHEQTGYLVEPHVVSDLCAAIKHVIEFPEEALSIAAEARVVAQAQFGLGPMVAAYNELYRQLAP